MPIQKVSKEQIIKYASDLFRIQGYHKTSMDDIAKASGILKGSVYHHFKSKEALMKAVLEASHKFFKDEILIYAYNDKRSVKARMKDVLNFIKKECAAKEACMMSSIASETSSTIPAFRMIIRSFFTDWIDAFTFIYKGKHKEKKAEKMAKKSVQELGGAFMLLLVFEDHSYVENSIDNILAEL